MCIRDSLSPDNIEGARRGLYPPHALVELPPSWVLDWFEEGQGSGPGGAERFMLTEQLRASTQFLDAQDVTQQSAHTPDGRKFDLIVSCYAICLYLDKTELTEVVSRMVRECLAPGGFLVIGINDHLPAGWRELGLTAVACKSWGNKSCDLSHGVKVFQLRHEATTFVFPLELSCEGGEEEPHPHPHDNPSEWPTLLSFLEGTGRHKEVDWINEPDSKMALMCENSRKIFERAVAEGRVPSGDAHQVLILDFKQRLRRSIELESLRALEDSKKSLFAKTDDAAMGRFLGRAEKDQQKRHERLESEIQLMDRAEERKLSKQRAAIKKSQCRMRKLAKRAAKQHQAESQGEQQEAKQQEQAKAREDRKKQWRRRLLRDAMVERKRIRDREMAGKIEMAAEKAAAVRQAELLRIHQTQTEADPVFLSRMAATAGGATRQHLQAGSVLATQHLQAGSVLATQHRRVSGVELQSRAWIQQLVHRSELPNLHDPWAAMPIVCHETAASQHSVRNKLGSLKARKQLTRHKPPPMIHLAQAQPRHL
eukprot:TRINITY_DN9072_c0_g1_i2.p1 TRINITY_DN9072_c0_g1~~TRINITY_DN9072_c0_g1_i2.p1  ORF type:complete len:538 (+),score=126.78 TRINITY_DN9072_c0_g1_i2:176-1789(+)